MNIMEHAIRDVLVTPERPDAVVEHMVLKGFDEVEVRAKLWSMYQETIRVNNMGWLWIS